MMRKLIVFIFFFAFVQVSFAQNHILYLGAVAHLGNGLKIENAAIGVKNGKFSLVADANSISISPTSYDTIIKLGGKHIYPAFIVPNTTLGITEIGQVRATHDFKEVGSLNPNIRTLIAYNTDSKISKTVRTNGVLLAQVTPRGGTISGQSSVMHLDGWNWEDAVLRTDDGLHLNWPNSDYYTGRWAEPEKTKKYNNRVSEIKSFFTKAEAYAKSANIMDLRMESMKGLFNGTKTLYIHADYAKDMRKAIQMASSLNIKKIVIVGAEDALKIVDLLKEKNISLILNRIHRLPDSQDSPIDDPFTQAKKLKETGILFCLSYEGDMEAMGARNLPFSAGTAVAYGMDYEDAIAAITLNAAKILGIDAEVGSIEHDKNATFFISSGDALDMRTNNVEQAFISGKTINLNNHQKELFEKYKGR